MVGVQQEMFARLEVKLKDSQSQMDSQSLQLKSRRKFDKDSLVCHRKRQSCKDVKAAVLLDSSLNATKLDSPQNPTPTDNDVSNFDSYSMPDSHKYFKRQVDGDFNIYFKNFRVLESYEHKKLLSQGKISEVHLIQHKLTKHQMALKIVDLQNFSDIQIQLLKYNLMSMSQIDHPNIVKVASWSIENQIAFILT